MTRVVLARCVAYRDGFVRRKLFSKVIKLFFSFHTKHLPQCIKKMFFSLILLAYIFEAMHGDTNKILVKSNKIISYRKTRILFKTFQFYCYPKAFANSKNLLFNHVIEKFWECEHLLNESRVKILPSFISSHKS